jgi:hypothetical protein
MLRMLLLQYPQYPDNHLQPVPDPLGPLIIHRRVCAGQLGLADAQREIVDDWQAAYHRYARVKCRRHKDQTE